MAEERGLRRGSLGRGRALCKGGVSHPCFGNEGALQKRSRGRDQEGPLSQAAWAQPRPFCADVTWRVGCSSCGGGGEEIRTEVSVTLRTVTPREDGEEGGWRGEGTQQLASGPFSFQWEEP